MSILETMKEGHPMSEEQVMALERIAGILSQLEEKNYARSGSAGSKNPEYDSLLGKLEVLSTTVQRFHTVSPDVVSQIENLGTEVQNLK